MQRYNVYGREDPNGTYLSPYTAPGHPDNVRNYQEHLNRLYGKRDSAASSNVRFGIPLTPGSIFLVLGVLSLLMFF